MKLLVDENIPGAERALRAFGEVRLMAGREIQRDSLSGIDALIVRSITRVDRALLENTSVRFVGTATAGVDHVNQNDLLAMGMGFASAPGSNADSVVDYVLASLAVAFPDAPDLDGRTVGIIGCGEVGSRLLSRLRALRIEVMAYDPWLPQDRYRELTSLEQVLACDVLSLHVPLVSDGPHPTRHLLGANRLEQLGSDVLLINAARGPVIDNRALLDWLSKRPSAKVVLDTWEHEPAVNAELMARCLIATPHIAGYAMDGKYRGLNDVVHAMARFFAMPLAQPDVVLEPAGTLSLVGSRLGAAWQSACLSAYPIHEDDRRMRSMMASTTEEQARRSGFDALRKRYPERREFSAWQIPGAALTAAERAALSGAGFSVV